MASTVSGVSERHEEDREYVIVHPAMGIYLGSCLGLGFWSLLDPVGQAVACTFLSEEEARSHVLSWYENHNPDIYEYVPVYNTGDAGYVGYYDLSLAGLEREALSLYVAKEWQ